MNTDFRFGEDFVELFEFNGPTDRGLPLTGRGVWSNEDRRYTFTPDALLEYGQRYQVTVPGTVELVSGGTISSGINEEFDTAEGPIGVVENRPRGVERNPDERIIYEQQFGLDFNVPMNPETVKPELIVESLSLIHI